MADQARPEAVGADQEVSDAPPTQRWLLMLLRAIVALLLGLVVLVDALALRRVRRPVGHGQG